jgi:[ribosomal protein S18]-alanine N-acetyltransferase
VREVGRFIVRPMTAADALAIAEWRYPEPYSFYDWDQDPDDLAELLDPSERGRRYFAADDGPDGLAGFFVFTVNDAVAEVGLGLRPDLTGRGIGTSFLDAGLRFAAETFRIESSALAVAAFDRRAIAVYERAGSTRSGAMSTGPMAASMSSSGWRAGAPTPDDRSRWPRLTPVRTDGRKDSTHARHLRVAWPPLMTGVRRSARTKG